MKKIPSLKRVPVSVLFYALSDPARMAIIQILLQKKEVNCWQCQTHLSKSTMSHHFKVLREAGLIERREEGKLHFISLRVSEIEGRLPGLLKSLRSVKGPF